MPDYALAPEHPYPTQLNQCYDTLLWARKHAAEWNARATWDAVAGDSAGGNLSTAICLRCLREGNRVPALQVLAYPVVDMRVGEPRESEMLYGTGYNLDYKHLLSYNAAYATPAQWLDPLVSPLAPTNGYKGIGLAAVYTQDNMKVTFGARYLDLGNAQPETGTPDTPRAEMAGNHAVAVGVKVGFTF